MKKYYYSNDYTYLEHGFFKNLAENVKKGVSKLKGAIKKNHKYISRELLPSGKYKYTYKKSETNENTVSKAIKKVTHALGEKIFGNSSTKYFFKEWTQKGWKYFYNNSKKELSELDDEDIIRGKDLLGKRGILKDPFNLIEDVRNGKGNEKFIKNVRSGFFDNMINTLGKFKVLGRGWYPGGDKRETIEVKDINYDEKLAKQIKHEVTETYNSLYKEKHGFFKSVLSRIGLASRDDSVYAQAWKDVAKSYNYDPDDSLSMTRFMKLTSDTVRITRTVNGQLMGRDNEELYHVDHISDLPKKTYNGTGDQDAIFANYRYGHGYDDEYYSNCYSCTMAYEMRRRGYDVTAIPDDNGEFSADYILNTFIGSNKESQHVRRELSNYKEKISDDDLNMLESTLKSKFSDGARGNLAVGWTRYGSGHSISWEIQDGDLIIRDCQTGEVYHSLKEISDRTYGMWRIDFTRLDNLEVTDNICRYVEVLNPYDK